MTPPDSSRHRLGQGTRLGPYEVESFVGAGGMGEVYRARDTRLGREVAVKVITAAADAGAVARFAREARAAGALQHPNVLVVLDVGESGGRPYLVTEWLRGRSLRERLADGPLPWRLAAQVGAQVAAGLAAAHARGIVHRDVKPENLFLVHPALVKILDFGVAKLCAALPDGDTRFPTAIRPALTTRSPQPAS